MSLRVDGLKQSRSLWPLLILAALLLSLTMNPGLTPRATVRMPDLRHVALAFEPSVGQTDPQVQFVTHASGATIFYTAQEVVLALTTAAAQDDVPAQAQTVRLQFVGSNPAPALTAAGESVLPHSVSGPMTGLRSTARLPRTKFPPQLPVHEK